MFLIYQEPSKAPFTYIHENRRQRIKSLKIVIETSNENQFSYFYVLNPFLKLTKPGPTQHNSDALLKKMTLIFFFKNDALFL